MSMGCRERGMHSKSSPCFLHLRGLEESERSQERAERLLLRRERRRTGEVSPSVLPPPPCPPPSKGVLQEPRETWGGRGLRLLLCGLGPTPGQGALPTGAFQGEVTVPAQACHLDCSPPPLPGHWPQGGKSYSLASEASYASSPGGTSPEPAAWTGRSPRALASLSSARNCK